MDMTKALKRHKQVGEHTGGGRRAGAYGSCIFNFFRNICNLSIVAVPVYIATNSAFVGPLSVTDLPAFVTSSLFDDRHPNRRYLVWF